jgi:hypothetical protein
MAVHKAKLRFLGSINNRVTNRVGLVLAQLKVIESNLRYISEYRYSGSESAVVDSELLERLADCEVIAQKANKIADFTLRAALQGVDVESKW